MLSSPWIAALVALFLWWFSTGAILWAVKRADRNGRAGNHLAVVLGLPLLLIGGAVFDATLGNTSVKGAYAAFLAALSIWGWIELAFLTGVVAGPNTRPCPPGVGPWERFLSAFGTIAYHELLLFAALLVMVWWSDGAQNKLAVWTFGVLFFARISAKLNLFFGVAKVNTEFLPRALEHLPSHFRTARLNPVFPVSVTALAFAVACWLERIYGAGTEAQAVGFALLAALTGLALLEHWLMVLPLPDERLWRWMIPAPVQNEKRLMSEDPNGL